VYTGARDGSLFFWNIANGALLKRYRAHKGQVSALTPMSFNGYVPPCSMAAGDSGQVWLSGGTDGMLKLWDAREKASVMAKELHTPSGVGVLEPVPTIVSPGSLVMSGGADNFVHLLDARRNLEPIYSWQTPHKNCIYSCLSIGMVPERMGGTRGAGNPPPHSPH
jgi:WD40 repeat protein